MDIVEKVKLYQRFVDANVREAKKAIDRFGGSVDKALEALGRDPVECRDTMAAENREEDRQRNEARRRRMDGTPRFEYETFKGPDPRHEDDEVWLDTLLSDRGKEGWLMCGCFMRGQKPVVIFAREIKN